MRPSPCTPTLRTRIDSGAGDLLVRVPSDADVRLRADTGLGEVNFDGQVQSGPGTELDRTDLGDDGVASGRMIELDVDLGVGQLEVRRG